MEWQRLWHTCTIFARLRPQPLTPKSKSILNVYLILSPMYDIRFAEETKEWERLVNAPTAAVPETRNPKPRI